MNINVDHSNGQLTPLFIRQTTASFLKPITEEIDGFLKTLESGPLPHSTMHTIEEILDSLYGKISYLNELLKPSSDDDETDDIEQQKLVESIEWSIHALTTAQRLVKRFYARSFDNAEIATTDAGEQVREIFCPPECERAIPG